MTPTMPVPACVCVTAAGSCTGRSADSTESHDGAASPPRGRVLRTRRVARNRTTTATKSLVSSSSRPPRYQKFTSVVA